MNGSPGQLAVVMGGGGARAAYQAGVLRAITRRYPKLAIPILTGVSAGAINTVFLACHTGDMERRVVRLTDLWRDLTTESVFRADSVSLLRTAARWGVRLVSGGQRITPQPRGMVDTSPLRTFLNQAFGCRTQSLPGILENLRNGGLSAVGITTTDYATGRSITHVQSNGHAAWSRPNRMSVETKLKVDHVMASAALPLFFPAVKIGGEWHGDGGIGLTAPLSPALHLGAERILVISTRYVPKAGEIDEPLNVGYPPPAQIIGQLLNAIFLDVLDQDAMNLDRINQLLEATPAQRRLGLRPAQLLLLRPSRNIAAMAGESEWRLRQPFKFLMRGTGTKETRSPESLSMVMFEPTYIRNLIELGEQDADRRMSDIAAFLEGEQRPGLQMTGFWRV
jgi:NTE family protein